MSELSRFSASLTFGPHTALEIVLAVSKSSKGKKGKINVYAPPMSEFHMLRAIKTAAELAHTKVRAG